jgi:hypothetical protein
MSTLNGNEEEKEEEDKHPKRNTFLGSVLVGAMIYAHHFNSSPSTSPIRIFISLVAMAMPWLYGCAGK